MPTEQKARKIAERYIAKPAFNWKAVDSVTLARAYLDTLAELQAAQEREKVAEQEALEVIGAELQRAQRRFSPFASAHEAIAVIREEYLELERAIFHGSGEDALCEAVQLAAMSARYVVDIDARGRNKQRTEEPSDDEGLEPIETSPLTEREPPL